MSGIADEKYVLFTTFRRSGEAVATPVWIADLGAGRAGFTTGSTSGKAKRLRNNPQVTLIPCTARGAVKPGAQEIAATAAVCGPGPELDATRRGIKGKYGVMVTLITAVERLRAALTRQPAPHSDAAVIVSLPQ